MYACSGSLCSDRVLSNMSGAIMEHAAPGMTAGVITSRDGSPALIVAAGQYTYDAWSSTNTDQTLYDMASCSKIMATTTAAAILYQKGLLGLDAKVASEELLGPGFASRGKDNITVRNLLLHNAGFPPDPVPGYSDPSFPCPQNANYHPAQEFSCVTTIFNDLLFNQTIVTPPGDVFVYSDLSMITLMFVVGKIVMDNHLIDGGDMSQPCFDRTNLVCNFNTFAQRYIYQRYNMTSTGYVPTNAELCPPLWMDKVYRHGVIKGYVSDENAYALGGISGHAGVFTTVHDALKLMRVWLFASDPDQLNSTTIALWTTVANLTQSSRALGWDTNDQSYAWCGSFSKKAFLHIGYTGTELCADPEVGVATVLLTNGKYPNRDTGMVWYRPQFNSMIHELLVAGWSSSPRGSSDGMTSEQIAFSAGGGALILVLVLVAAARMVKRGGSSAADRRDELLISEQSLGRKNID